MEVAINLRFGAYTSPPAQEGLLRLSFVHNERLAQSIASDMDEAMTCISDAPKRAALLAAGAIEGVLLGFLLHPEVRAHRLYPAITANLKKRRHRITWREVGLPALLASVDHARIRALGVSTRPLTLDVKAIRDTIHPWAERRRRRRAGQGDADRLILLFGALCVDLERFILGIGSAKLEEEERRLRADPMYPFVAGILDRVRGTPST